MPVTIDTSNLNGFCKRIAATPGLGRNAWDVMLFEVGKILERCVDLTTRDRVNNIKTSIAFKNRTLFSGKGTKSPILYVTKAGIAWFADYPGEGYEGVAKGGKTGSGKTFHPMTEFFHYGNPRWGRYQEMLEQLKGKQIDVRGVIGRAGQTWVQMADAAGIKLSGVPDYVRNATPFKGNTKRHGFAAMSRGLWLTMVNQGKVVLGTIDGNRILQTSINGRYKYFLESMRRGVFEDVKMVARQYQGLVITT
jgi:hypothetical protein